MASGDTKTNQYLDIAANGTRADLPSDTCCETRTQTLTREVAERIITEEETRAAADAVLQGEIDDMKNNPDVVDIVGTYADLQAYDTSTLTDKDIIRVLEDSTHNDRPTYYRWTISGGTGSWVYVGEAGAGGIPTDATFWGASYDATSNKVDEKQTLTLQNSNTLGTPQLKLKTSQGNVRGGLGVNYTGANEVFLLNNDHDTRVVVAANIITLGGGLSTWPNHSTYGVNVSNGRIHNVGDPYADQDAATKKYVDGLVGDIESALSTINNGGGE